jgi:hypothetical protein
MVGDDKGDVRVVLVTDSAVGNSKSPKVPLQGGAIAHKNEARSISVIGAIEPLRSIQIKYSIIEFLKNELFEEENRGGIPSSRDPAHQAGCVLPGTIQSSISPLLDLRDASLRARRIPINGAALPALFAPPCALPPFLNGDSRGSFPIDRSRRALDMRHASCRRACADRMASGSKPCGTLSTYFCQSRKIFVVF